MSTEIKLTNQQIVDICVRMESGESTILISDHNFEPTELSDLTTKISLNRGGKKSVVYLTRDPNEPHPQRRIIAECRVPE